MWYGQHHHRLSFFILQIYVVYQMWKIRPVVTSKRAEALPFTHTPRSLKLTLGQEFFEKSIATLWFLAWFCVSVDMPPYLLVILHAWRKIAAEANRVHWREEIGLIAGQKKKHCNTVSGHHSLDHSCIWECTRDGDTSHRLHQEDETETAVGRWRWRGWWRWWRCRQRCFHMRNNNNSCNERHEGWYGESLAGRQKNWSKEGKKYDGLSWRSHQMSHGHRVNSLLSVNCNPAFL